MSLTSFVCDADLVDPEPVDVDLKKLAAIIKLNAIENGGNPAGPSTCCASLLLFQKIA